MANFFFGKITDKIDPNQLPGGYYEADSKSWFGNLNEGDYVYIVAGSSKGAGKVHFWKAKKWSSKSGKIRMDFDKIVTECISKPVLLSSLIHFKLNMDLVIKSVRPTANEKNGFFKMIPIDNNTENLVLLLSNPETYKNTDTLYRKIIIYSNLANLQNDKQKHDNDIQLYYDADGIIKIMPKDFIDEKLINDFHGNISEIQGSRKENLLKKFELNDQQKIVVDISIRDFYDVFISKNNKNTKKDIKSTSSNISNTYSNQNIKVMPPKFITENIPLNQILYGPPGTGKTFSTIEYALKILLVNTIPSDHTDQKKIFDELKKEGRIVFTTFHQSMSYEDFVQGIKPKTDNKKGNIIYKVERGIFRQICDTAITAQERTITVEGTEYSITKNCVLIIDEINRGNVSEIFGELITLIESDKRIDEKNEITVQLPTSDGSDKAFGVPNNVYIIGTMNTADRSVEALDTALRRRFSFVEMMPKYDLPELNKIIAGKELKAILQTINDRIIWLKGREQQIGHSYFIGCNNLDDLKIVFKNKIVPLLQEYFYGNYHQIGLVIGESFVEKEEKCRFASGFVDNSDRDDLYRLLTDKEWKDLDMEKAINNLFNLKDSNNSTQSGEEASIDN